MVKTTTQINSELYTWKEIKDEFLSNQIGLLIGNGMSCAVWNKFQYPSLYENASSSSTVQHPLSLEDKQLFDSWEANGNFEKILYNLLITKRTNQILGLPDNSGIQKIIRERYGNIQRALIEAVEEVHIPWLKFQKNEKNILINIRRELLNYKYVYSTNYDLLIYWAIMSKPDSFKDYFWNDDLTFNIENTGVSRNSTKVLYLHGALHLCREIKMGRTWKIANDEKEKESILDQFKTLWDIDRNVTPLFVAEGDSRNKLESIYSSDYLSFAYSEFRNHEGSLVIFGHSLGDSDKHLIDAIKEAIKEARIRKIAISIRKSGNSDDAIIERKAILRKVFCGSKLFFFEAETHPLGSPDMKIE